MAVPYFSGKVILSTIRSMSGAVYELVVEGVTQPIEPTAAHPFYTLDREEWVAAGRLQVGELIRTRDGSTRVLGIAPRPGLFSVVNLEVETTHQFLVSQGLVLTHNAQANACAASGASGGASRPKVNTGLSDRVTSELKAGDTRTPAENRQARSFFENHKQEAMDWWSGRNGNADWPGDATHAEHPRALKDGGDPLFVEPGYNGPNAAHMIPRSGGLTDAQRWGRLGGRPKKK